MGKTAERKLGQNRETEAVVGTHLERGGAGVGAGCAQVDICPFQTFFFRPIILGVTHYCPCARLGS